MAFIDTLAVKCCFEALENQKFNYEVKEKFLEKLKEKLKDNIYFLMASILWPLLTIVSAKDSKTNGLVFTFYVYVISTFVVYLFFVDNSVFEKVASFDMKFWLNMFMITILSTTFATSIYFIAIAKIGTKEATTFIFLVPASAMVSSAIYLGEKISFNTIIGTICTIIAIYILNNLSLIKLLKK